ncbi:Tox-REase-5 domain-containing protein [Stenotrophomonas sp. RAC2]|uniref:Tox-REase-5 domain-containing protein n=1 Tax=Stenotrophomonas sp. RAC2 TaxID=3064902 RepID=UPI002717ED61|nr:Tox-REase-5 domain-containing protein [Stenotrophomonas sp. RAC2]MDV9042023.1 Tox-REase-5 domain-containing protein [Stenotrophomonas sp. RAC2]
MASALPIGGRAIGEVIRRSASLERLRRAIGVIPIEQAKEGDCTNQSSSTECNQCKLDQGVLVPAAPRRAVRRENKVNWDYQLQTANMNAGPERFSYCDKNTGLPITDFETSLVGRAWSALKGESQPNAQQLNLLEWLYGGVYFDGFWRAQCTVVDAKGRYAQFLSQDDGAPKLGFPSRFIFPGMIEEAGRQIAVINTASPQGKLQWHFMEIEVYRWASSSIPPPVVCVHTPYILQVVQA